MEFIVCFKSFFLEKSRLLYVTIFWVNVSRLWQATCSKQSDDEIKQKAMQ